MVWTIVCPLYKDYLKRIHRSTYIWYVYLVFTITISCMSFLVRWKICKILCSSFIMLKLQISWWSNWSKAASFHFQHLQKMASSSHEIGKPSQAASFFPFENKANFKRFRALFEPYNWPESSQCFINKMHLSHQYSPLCEIYVSLTKKLLIRQILLVNFM